MVLHTWLMFIAVILAEYVPSMDCIICLISDDSLFCCSGCNKEKYIQIISKIVLIWLKQNER